MADAQKNRRQTDRPLSVTLVILGVLALGLANVWRAIALFQQRTLLNELGARTDPVLRSSGALLWAGIFILLVIGLWWRWAPARFVTPGILLAYGFYQLVLTQLLTFPAELSAAWAPTALQAAIIVFTVWALNRKAAQKYFEVS
jgi:hypothetical protein